VLYIASFNVIILSRSLLILLLITSCVSSDPHHPLPSTVRQELGSFIAIGVLPPIERTEVKTPFMRYRSGPTLSSRLSEAKDQTLDQALEGAGIGSTTGQVLGLIPCLVKDKCMLQLATVLATTPVGMAIGGATGAASGFLAGQTELSHEVSSAIRGIGIPSLIENEVYNAVKDISGYRFSRISYPDDINPLFLAALYESLTANEVGAVLELSLSRIAFVGTADDGPHDLQIEMTSKLIRTSDLKVLDMRTWAYKSSDWHGGKTHTFAEWRADDALLLRNSLNRFYPLIALWIKRGYFGCPPGYFCGKNTRDSVASEKPR